MYGQVATLALTITVKALSRDRKRTEPSVGAVVGFVVGVVVGVVVAVVLGVVVGFVVGVVVGCKHRSGLWMAIAPVGRGRCGGRIGEVEGGDKEW